MGWFCNRCAQMVAGACALLICQACTGGTLEHRQQSTPKDRGKPVLLSIEPMVWPIVARSSFGTVQDASAKSTGKAAQTTASNRGLIATGLFQDCATLKLLNPTSRCIEFDMDGVLYQALVPRTEYAKKSVSFPFE